MNRPWNPFDEQARRRGLGMRSAEEFSLSLAQYEVKPHTYLLWEDYLDEIVGLANTIIYVMYMDLTEDAQCDKVIALIREVSEDAVLKAPSVLKFLHLTFEEEYQSRRYEAWRTYRASVWHFVE